MEYRKLGKSGLSIPVLSFGTGTFGGTTEFFKRWGQTRVEEAKKLVGICLERGINFFDTANVYSLGESELVLGQTIKGNRNGVLISTKAGFAMGEGPNEKGASRHHLLLACEASLRRLGTEYIDIYFIHGFDETTPLEETLTALHSLVQSGKVRYIGCSNFAAWQLMKSLSVSEKLLLEKFVIYQGNYSLIGRDYEQELMPLLKDQGMGLMAWSPLGWGRLTGKLKRDGTATEGRIKEGGLEGAPPVADDYLFNVLDCLKQISEEIDKPIPQIALNWLSQQPTVSNIVVGARTETQLLSNIDALSWQLSKEHVDILNNVSYQPPIYPHWVGQR